MKDVRLSFLEIVEESYSFEVYRKEYDGALTPDDGLSVYNLIADNSLDKYQKYYVTFGFRDGFELYKCSSEENRFLTQKILLDMLREGATKSGVSFVIHDKSFLKRIDLLADEHTEGNRYISFTPYYLERKKKFGFLVDMKFHPISHSFKVNDRTLKLTFSLNKFGEANKNFYADKFNFVSQYLAYLLPKVGTLRWENDRISINNSFTSMPISILEKKKYIFGERRSYGVNQFRGIKESKPYKCVQGEALFIFILEDRFRDFANKLFLSLIGKQNPGTFPGMKQFFDLDISKSNVRKVHIANNSQEELSRALVEVADLSKTYPFAKKIAIYVEESSNPDTESVSDNYYYLKYNLTKLKVPLQVLSYEKINPEQSLKWATSNIGLALFSKLGGSPWVVKPSTADCLILGIGSAHKFDESGNIERYFAYSVCLDSSGIYKKLEVLADDHSEESYLDALKRNLTSLLQNDEFVKYRKCALHLPFKIKQKEIDSIEKAISNVRSLDFKVIKINIKNKFFGYGEHNTKTPYESTLIKLNGREFLVWFEGLLMGEEIIKQRISPPVHIEFLNLNGTSKDIVDPYLQDIINLTGANWRGFNARVKPISIYYSTLIARFCKEFEKFPDFQKEMLALETPWFL